MKLEILDFRTFLTIVLVVLSLAGNRWSSVADRKTDTQNLSFIPPNSVDMVTNFPSLIHLGNKKNSEGKNYDLRPIKE
jgi:hypothetical protein